MQAPRSLRSVLSNDPSVSSAPPELNLSEEEKSIESRIDALLAEMTIEEKAAQMRIFHAGAYEIEYSDDGKLELTEAAREMMAHGIAGIKNPGEHYSPERSAEKTNALQRHFIENTRLGIPALFVTEAYNGVDADGTTKFCRPVNMAATWNVELVEKIWDVMGREARLRGLHMCHSPEADLMRDPRFGRMSEAFGEDTHLTTEMVVAAVNGVQGHRKGLGEKTHIGAVTKHFAGYGQIDGGRNFSSVTISERDLIDQIFPPFEAAVRRAGTLGIMPSHGDLNGIACHGNPRLLTEVLREKWGFRGYTVSDSNDIARLYFLMRVAEDEDHAALMGLQAGMDIDLYNEDCYVRLPRLAAEDSSIVPAIDNAVRNVLRTKFILGLFDDPYVDPAKAAQETHTAASLKLAQRADEESVILLKNKDSLLPYPKDKAKTIALVGPILSPGAASQFASVFGDDVSFVEERGFKLTDEAWDAPVLASQEEWDAGLEKAVAAASAADLVVLYLGGDAHTAKEAFFGESLGDRASLELVGPQDELLRRVKALGKDVVVVLKHRRTLAINEIAASADAVLDAWDLSERGDTALARIITGEVVPSGKSPVTIPRSLGQIPFHYCQKPINFTKGYLFQENGPLYPFGFGLSFTEFDYSPITLSTSEVTATSGLTASVEVSNVGGLAGKEVVQLYIRDLISSAMRPLIELKAFQKIELQAGETRTVSFDITPDMLAFTGIEMDRRVEQGDFEIRIGTSSAAGQSATFRVVE